MHLMVGLILLRLVLLSSMIILGNNSKILWGEVDKVGDELFWCEGGAKLPSEAFVNGSMKEPFFLVSFENAMPNLNAVPLNNSVILKEAFCVYSQEIVKLCNSGNRTKTPTFFEKIVKKYKLDVKL
jgi:hypothetical protein